MSRAFFLRALALSSVVWLCGCGVESRTYSVSLRNLSHSPVTVGLVKHGGPLEEAWLTPEQLTRSLPGAARLPSWGSEVPPGANASKTQSGAFRPDTVAFVRIYRGKRTLSQLLAMSSADPDRVDVPLDPGKNVVIVSEEDFHLVAKAVQQDGP